MASNGKLSDIPMPLAIMVISVVICIVIFVGLYIFNFGHFLSENTEVWGQFGDYIGGILNPFIAFTALLGLSYTILLQRKQMQQAEEDFKAQSAAQNEQLRHAAEAFQSQKLAQEKQAFESIFFQLVSIFNVITTELVYDHNCVTYKGRECAKYLIKDLIEQERVASKLRPTVASSMNIYLFNDDFVKLYEDFHIKNINNLGHYFRVLFNVLKFIDNSSLEDEQKKFYANIIRAQLSQHELGLLFYNCTSKYGEKKFFPLIMKYKILKHIDISSLADAYHFSILNSWNPILHGNG